MNISPIMLNNYLAIKKQNIKNYQTQPNFKSLNCDTISFQGTNGSGSQERIAFITKHQELSQMLNKPSVKTAQKCIDSLKNLQDDKDCPADLKSEILLGQDKQAMNKVIKLYMDTRYKDEKTLLFNLIEAMISASPNKETTLAQFTAKDANGRIPIQIAYSDKKMAERIYKCFEHDSEALFAQCEAAEEARAAREFAKYEKLQDQFFPRCGKIGSNFIGYLEDLIEPREDLIEPGENPDKPIIIRDQKARDSIVKFAISNNLPARYFRSIEEHRIKGYTPTLKAIADLATPKEKRTLFLNRNFLNNCRNFEDIMFAWYIFKDDMKAKNEICTTISSLTNREGDVSLFDSLSVEQMRIIIDIVGPEARKKLLLATDKLDLLPISYTDEETQIEFLKASPDDETREKQILALPKLTQEALELVPGEKREEIKQRYDEAFNKRIKSIKNNPVSLRKQTITAREDSNKTKLGMGIILLHDPEENHELVVNTLLYLGASGHEAKLLGLTTNPYAYVELIKALPLETVAKNAVEYCKNAPSDDAILKIMEHYDAKLKFNKYEGKYYYCVETVASSITPEQAFEILNLFKDPKNQIQFLNASHKHMFLNSPTEEKVAEELYCRDQRISGLFLEYSACHERLLDVLFNIALDENIDYEELDWLFETYDKVINEYNFAKLLDKLKTIVDNNDEEQAENLLTLVREHVPELYQDEIDKLLERLN